MKKSIAISLTLGILLSLLLVGPEAAQGELRFRSYCGPSQEDRNCTTGEDVRFVVTNPQEGHEYRWYLDGGYPPRAPDRIGPDVTWQYGTTGDKRIELFDNGVTYAAGTVTIVPPGNSAPKVFELRGPSELSLPNGEGELEVVTDKPHAGADWDSLEGERLESVAQLVRSEQREDGLWHHQIRIPQAPLGRLKITVYVWTDPRYTYEANFERTVVGNRLGDFHSFVRELALIRRGKAAKATLRFVALKPIRLQATLSLLRRQGARWVRFSTQRSAWIGYQPDDFRYLGSQLSATFFLTREARRLSRAGKLRGTTRYEVRTSGQQRVYRKSLTALLTERR